MALVSVSVNFNVAYFAARLLDLLSILQTPAQKVSYTIYQSLHIITALHNIFLSSVYHSGSPSAVWVLDWKTS